MVNDPTAYHGRHYDVFNEGIEWYQTSHANVMNTINTVIIEHALLLSRISIIARIWVWLGTASAMAHWSRFSTFYSQTLQLTQRCFSKPLKWRCVSFTHSNVMVQWTLWSAAKVSPARLKLLHGSLVRPKLASASDCRALFGVVSNRRARV